MLRRLITLVAMLMLVGSVAGQLQAASNDGIANACLVIDSASSGSPDTLVDGDPPEMQFDAAVGHSGGFHCFHTLTIRLDAASLAPPGLYEVVRWGHFASRAERLAFPPSHRPPARAS